LFELLQLYKKMGKKSKNHSSFPMVKRKIEG